jgi:dienelactone hydrolase
MIKSPLNNVTEFEGTRIAPIEAITMKPAENTGQVSSAKRRVPAVGGVEPLARLSKVISAVDRWSTLRVADARSGPRVCDPQRPGDAENPEFAFDKRSRRLNLVPWFASAILLATVLTNQADEPIRLHPDNPRYFRWRGKPTVLITAGEHYGAVMNLDFDYKRYLEELKANRFNLTRVFSGAYREVSSSFNITGNTLAPAKGRYVCPWAPSETPGAVDGENKFDLTRWDAAYFGRLKDFVTQAGQRGVVVELVFFCPMYDEAVWSASPMNARNNVNGLGNVAKSELYSGKDKNLLAIQKAMVAKLVTELNDFDNLYFEICNEPYERGGLTREWNDEIIAAIANTEAILPKKHLIAQGFPPSSAPVTEINSRVSILNFHAATTDSVRLNHSSNRIIAFDETGGADRSDRKYRTEGWDWILAGGGVYDHLDFAFTIDHPDGSAVPLPPGTPGGGGPELRRQLRVLKEFIEGFAFIRMKPDDTTIKSNRITVPKADGAPEPVKPTVHALSEPGQAYAVYVNGGRQAELVMELPAAKYKAEWINPKTGHEEKIEKFSHSGGDRTVSSPGYSEDIALRVTRQPPAQALLRKPPDEIAEFFAPPERYRSDFGNFQSPLVFADGTRVQNPADWQRRREEILLTWHKMLGPWPPLIKKPRVEVMNTTRRESIVQQQLRIEIAIGGEMVDALLLVPDGDVLASKRLAQKRPAVLVVYYDAETGAGLGAPLRDYGWQLAKRGFVALSIGKPNAHIDLEKNPLSPSGERDGVRGRSVPIQQPRTEPYLGIAGKPARVEPLSALAYAAANAHTVLVQRPDVDSTRIGIVGHSFGGKWAMFASCLYDKFACAVWSDPGIVFDERDRRKQNPNGSVNYWDVWYLGFELGAIADPKNAGPFRKLPTDGQPRTGAYQALVEGGHDLVELHALMAPRPFLVSGGTADLPERWPALNHSIAVNKLLGYDHRVAMTARDGHTPTEEANEQVYRFFEWWLKDHE